MGPDVKIQFVEIDDFINKRLARDEGRFISLGKDVKPDQGSIFFFACRFTKSVHVYSYRLFIRLHDLANQAVNLMSM
jgi:hypothetical protein